jgi:hypothetical protein
MEYFTRKTENRNLQYSESNYRIWRKKMDCMVQFDIPFRMDLINFTVPGLIVKIEDADKNYSWLLRIKKKKIMMNFYQIRLMLNWNV